jgi:fatty-acyl-CoA synthase
LPEHAISVRDAAGGECAERVVGRIFISGPSVAEGYFENPEATAEQWLGDGWLDTGDLGYWLDGQIVITGRSKDLIICNGRNIWPQDIEWAIEQLEGLRSGDVAAFSVDEEATELPVVLVQCRLRDDTEREELRKTIGAAVRNAAGVDAQVVLVPHRSLPVTSSGKLSRQGARQRFLAGEFADGGPSGQRRVSRRELGAGQPAE